MICCRPAPETLELEDVPAAVAEAPAGGAAAELEGPLLLQPAAASDAIAAMARTAVVLFRRQVADRSAWSDMATFPSALVGGVEYLQRLGARRGCRATTLHEACETHQVPQAVGERQGQDKDDALDEHADAG